MEQEEKTLQLCSEEILKTVTGGINPTAKNALIGTGIGAVVGTTTVGSITAIVGAAKHKTNKEIGSGVAWATVPTSIGCAFGGMALGATLTPKKQAKEVVETAVRTIK